MKSITTATNGLGEIRLSKVGKCLYTPEQRAMIMEKIDEYNLTHAFHTSGLMAAKYFNIEEHFKPNSAITWDKRRSVQKCRSKTKTLVTNDVLGVVKCRTKDSRPIYTDKQKKILGDLFIKHISNGNTYEEAESKVRNECGILEKGPSLMSLKKWANIDTKSYNVKKSANKQPRKSFNASTQPIGDNSSDIKERITTIGNLAEDADLEELSQCMVLIKRVSKTVASALQVKLQEFTNALG